MKIFHQLLKNDVVTENYRGGIAKKKVDYESLTKINPKITTN